MIERQPAARKDQATVLTSVHIAAEDVSPRNNVTLLRNLAVPAKPDHGGQAHVPPDQQVMTFTNRSIEKLFSGWSGHRQFLAKDSVSEVIMTR